MTGNQLPCRDVVELLTDHLEGTLDAGTERSVREHLAVCPPCVTYLEQLRGTAEALGRLPAPPIPPALAADLERAFADLHRH